MAEEKKKPADKSFAKKTDEKPTDAAKRDKEERPADEAKAAPGGPKVMFFALIAAVIIINTAMAFVLINVLAPKKAPNDEAVAMADSMAVKEAGGAVAAEGMAVTEKPIEAIVNIMGTDGKRYLKVGVALEYNAAKYKGLSLALEEHLMPKLKSILIEQVSALTLQELNEPQVKEKICKEYIRRINSVIPKKTGEFSEALITTFLIQ